MTVPQWDEMTIEDRNLLVAEKVMGWKSGQECEGYMGEQPNSSDGWFCQLCGHEGYWGDSFSHEALPPRYVESMDLALLILQRYKMVGLYRDNEDAPYVCHVFKSPITAVGVHEKAVDAICLAALTIEGRFKGSVYVQFDTRIKRSKA